MKKNFGQLLLRAGNGLVLNAITELIVLFTNGGFK